MRLMCFLQTRAQSQFAEAQLFVDDRNQSHPRSDEASARLRSLLVRYQVPDDGTENWLQQEDVRRLSEADRLRLRGDVGETFYLLAQVACLRALGSDDQAARAENLDRAGNWNGAAIRYAGGRLPRSAQEQAAVPSTHAIHRRLA